MWIQRGDEIRKEMIVNKGRGIEGRGVMQNRGLGGRGHSESKP